jgi:rRNA-processing protein FCF1
VRYHLLPAADVSSSIQLIDMFSVNAYNEAQPAFARTPLEKQMAYVNWARDCERRLLGVLVRSEVVPLFQNARHLEICSMGAGDQVLPMVSSEIEMKVAILREILSELKDAKARLDRAGGCPTVMDTNLLLQCSRPDQIRWASIIGEPVRLIIPLRVLEELDEKKYGASQRLRKVSREILPWIESLFVTSETGPVSVGDPESTTLELLFSDRPRFKPQDPDEEVLEVAHEVAKFAGRVKVVTADSNMRMRARAEGLDALQVPKSYWRISDDAEEKG